MRTVRYLCTVMIVIVPFLVRAAWAGDYTWTYLGDIGNGNSNWRLDGTISHSDIPARQLDDVCNGTFTCGMFLVGTQCDGNVSSTFNRISGVPDVDTPVTYLDKVGWRVSLNAGVCSDGSKAIRLLLNAYKKRGSSNGHGTGEDVILASNDGSGGGVLPPPTPEPDPLFCSLSLNNGGVIDWGTVALGDLNVGKLAAAGYEAKVTCSGDGTATAKLTFSSMNGSGNIAEMKNANGDVIPAKLIIYNELNTTSFSVTGGYNQSYTLFARIQAYNISTYGEYKGNALLTLELS